MGTGKNLLNEADLLIIKLMGKKIFTILHSKILLVLFTALVSSLLLEEFLLQHKVALILIQQSAINN